MNQPALTVLVECYAGRHGEEEPRRFYVGNRPVDVLEVMDHWLGPEHRYFRVRGDDQGIYILRHDVIPDRWELTQYERGAR